jgi:hypothetical protein
MDKGTRMIIGDIGIGIDVGVDIVGVGDMI